MCFFGWLMGGFFWGWLGGGGGGFSVLYCCLFDGFSINIFE